MKRVYAKLDPREAVLNAPEMYGGSVQRLKRKEYHYLDNRIVLQDTDVPFIMIHLAKECTSNVADNAVVSRQQGVDPGKCIINVEGDSFQIKSFGLPIDISYDKRYNQMIPYYIFSDLHSGGNFGSDRKGGGRHGLGAKLANIMSVEFSIEVKNATQGRSYSMTWYDHRSRDGEELTYRLDMKMLGYKRREAYSESAVQILKWVAACLSFTANMPVVFNGQTLQYTDPKKFAALYCEGGKLGKYVLHQTPEVKLLAVDAPNQGKQISFANSIITHSGGIHVNNALKALTLGLNAGKTDHKYDVRDIKRHVLLIISVNDIEKPEWGNGQTKTRLNGPASVKIELPVEVTDAVKKWSLTKMLEASLHARDIDKVFLKAKGKVKFVGKVKGKDANWAGHKTKWRKTVLSALEGDSAAQYEKELLNSDADGRDVYGVQELKGKPLNVMKVKTKGHVSVIDIALKNAEINQLITRLNLNPKLDYTDDNNLATLRYGKFRIMADPDPDGYHIAALLIAFFYTFFPTLLQRNDYIYCWFRPVIQATKGKKMMRFYSRKEYKEWLTEDPSHRNWTARYFKGLGSCTPEDIELDYYDHREVLMMYNAEAAEKINMAFGKVNNRGDWINGWDPDLQGDIPEMEMEIARFIDWYVREYAYETLLRNLPGIDGLTRAQRKVIYTSFKVWGRECGSNKKVKLQPNFAGYVGDKTRYHQGDSIPGVVVRLASDHRTNNIPLLKGYGAFGSIDGGFKDASQPRYLDVGPTTFLPLLFRSEDDRHLERIEDEGELIEPRFYAPVIPLALVNGIAAVGMGFSSTVPNYNPLKIINSYLARLESGKEFEELEPWYRDNHGITETIGQTFISYGVVEDVTKDGCTVTQLPLGLWHKAYEKKLDKWIEDGRIKDYNCHCTTTKTRYVIKGIAPILDGDGNPRKCTLEDLGLTKTMNLGNMTVVNQEGNAVTFKSVKAFQEAYYEFMLPIYVRRKEVMLKDILVNIRVYEQKLAFIEAIRSGQLVVDPVGNEELDEETVLERIRKLKLETGFYKATAGNGHSDKSGGKGGGNASADSGHGGNASADSGHGGNASADSGYGGKPTVRAKPITAHDRSIQGLKKIRAALSAERVRYDAINAIKSETMWINDLKDLKKEYIRVYEDSEGARYI
jgi:DNA topoisomerase-2